MRKHFHWAEAIAVVMLAHASALNVLGDFRAHAGEHNAGAMQATASVSPDSILFQDDFSGDLSKWEIVVGAWTIVDGRLRGVGGVNGWDAWIYAGDTSWTDYELSARVYFQPRGSNRSEAEFVLRCTEHWQNQYGGIGVFPYNWGPPGDSYNNRVAASYHVNGEDMVIARDTCMFLIPDTADVKMQVIGNRLAVYINGRFAWGDEHAPSLLHGRIGLGVIWDLTVEFDDVVVRRLSPASSFARLQTDTVSFGRVFSGTTSTKELTLYNDGATPLALAELYSYQPDLMLDTDCGVLLPGDSCIINIHFKPTTYGPVVGNGVIAFQGACEFANFVVTATVNYGQWEWLYAPYGYEFTGFCVGDSVINASGRFSGLFSGDYLGPRLFSSDLGSTWTVIDSLQGFDAFQLVGDTLFGAGVGLPGSPLQMSTDRGRT